MTTTAKQWTVNDIKTANRVHGYHWFNPDAMRSFGTRVLDEVYQGPGGIFFVTSDKRFDGSRGYTIRTFNPETGSVSSAKDEGRVGDLTKYMAKKRAKELAAGDGEATTITEAYTPVTILEQFVEDLRTHGSNVAGPGSARELIQQAARHHRYMEAECNHGNQFKENGEAKPWLKMCRRRILDLAKECGAEGVIFSGDPRGCTVKLKFKDGATNDFGKEGWCIPTSEKLED